jgi:hypothetical protein
MFIVHENVFPNASPFLGVNIYFHSYISSVFFAFVIVFQSKTTELKVSLFELLH